MGVAGLASVSLPTWIEACPTDIESSGSLVSAKLGKQREAQQIP